MTIITGWKVGALALAIAGLASLQSQADSQPQPPPAYAQNCASCHGMALEGATGPNIGPALRGPAFVAKWRAKTPADFLAYVHDAMPLSQPGSLDPKTSAEAANFVLAANRLPTGQPPAALAANIADSADQLTVPVREQDMDASYRTALATRAALLDRLTPVSDAMLDRPAPGDWLSWRGSAATLGYSGLDQIDRGNVGGLALAWSDALDPGTAAIAPIVHDGVMFLANSGRIEALDATNGDLLWQYSRPAKGLRIPISQTRSLALAGTSLFVATVDNHILALDAKSGRLLWDHEVAPPSQLLQLTAAPIIVHGKLIQGVSGCQSFGGGCYVLALDTVTGKELWRFLTIAQPGQPGGDSWNGAPPGERYGASVWVTPSYDAETNLLYVGVAQTYKVSTLLDRQKRKGASADALFTDATLALDPDTGKLAWYYQHMPGDVWDLDWAFERTVIGQGKDKIVLTGGKIGMFDALDARTGQYLWSFDLGLQNLVTKVDPKTGRKSYDPPLMPELAPKLICPAASGARNWLTTAYDPRSGKLFIPAFPTICMEYSRRPPAPGLMANDVMGESEVKHIRRPDGGDEHGMVAALDLATHKLAWTVRRRAPEASAILATAGGLVFEGSRDRTFRASDSDSGAALWETRLPNVPGGLPISYAVDGVQYVAIVTGGKTPIDLFTTAMAPEYPPSNGSRQIMVFRLPKGK
jgi:alcohol dehydrogenase (cytochrome c)